jgi:PAS domain S-box-containing protein
MTARHTVHPSMQHKLLLALLLPFIALALQWHWWAAIQPRWFVLFYPAVIFSGWLGGFAGGVAATLLSLLLMSVFFILPGLAPSGADYPIGQCLIFTLVGLSSAYLHRHAQRREKTLTDMQQQLQQALTTAQHNEAYAQAIFEQAPLGMAIVNASSGQFVQVNTRYSSIVGWSEHDLLHSTWMAITHPDDLADDLAAKAQLSRGETPQFDRIKRYLRADGSAVWTQVTVAPLCNPHDQDPLALVMAEDISTCKQLEQQLITVNQELDAIFDSAAVGMAYSRQHSVIRCNHQLEQMLGYPRNALQGQSTRTWFTHQHDFDSVEQGINAAIISGDTFSHKLQLQRKDGSVFWAHVIAHAVDVQDPDKGILKIIQDISQDETAHDELIRAKNQAEALNQALQAQQHTLKQLMQRLTLATEAADIGIWSWDLNTNHVEWDARMYKLYELRDEERLQPLSYATWRSHLHPDDRAAAEAALNEAIKHNSSFDYTYRIVRPNGDIRFITAASAMDFDSNGQPLRMVGINRDVTEQQQHQQLLEQARQQAESANSSKSAFLANMSHEIRTPLNAIVGLSLLLQDSELSAHQRDYLNKIGNASNILLNLINDILDYSKIEAGYLEFEKNPFQVADAIRNTVNLFRAKLDLKDLTLHTVLAPNLPSQVVGDSMRLEQVLSNLIGNAIKFTEQGEITITAEAMPNHTPNSGVWLRFCIRDSGIGIDSVAIDKLFTPFTQADASISRRYGGTGLGLSISQKLVDLMGGSISIDSQPGQGSTICFTACFDAAPQPPVDLTTATTAISNTTAELPELPEECRQALALVTAISGAQLLLIEDDPINQLVARGFLEKLQFEVTVANNGLEGITCLQQQPFDGVLLDIQMPDMDGFETIGHLRQLNNGKQVPIIALTASAMPDTIAHCLASGMDDHLAKPIEPLSLAKCLVKWIKPRQQPQQPASPKPTAAPLPALSATETAQLLLQLDALEPLLQQNMLTAKTLVNSIEATLAHSASAAEFSRIGHWVRQMRFKQALAALHTFRQHLPPTAYRLGADHAATAP